MLAAFAWPKKTLMGEFAIGDFSVTDVAGRPIDRAGFSRERIHGRVLALLEISSLCSIATVTPERTAHANTAFFAYSVALEIFFPILLPMALAWRESSGSAGIGAVSVGLVWFLPAAVLGFIVGFVLVFRRARRRPLAA